MMLLSFSQYMYAHEYTVGGYMNMHVNARKFMYFFIMLWNSNMNFFLVQFNNLLLYFKGQKQDQSLP